jgi:hypothetical protein
MKKQSASHVESVAEPKECQPQRWASPLRGRGGKNRARGKQLFATQPQQKDPNASHSTHAIGQWDVFFHVNSTVQSLGPLWLFEPASHKDNDKL